ncbi:putative UPF0481 protein At3g02645 [Cryptomeria japonica]|uniref:putative UPF0481 protein At3g02645 n=1 Tax=Cryptomeria japonica TaxID=3369 RepID=UPI0027DAA0BD|nr:putative UPF0481 protein At3g02645 [Cryptomeria japonica]
MVVMFAADRVEISNFIMMNGTHTAEGNGIAQIHDNASTKSWLEQVKNRYRSSPPKWQISTKVCIYRVPEPMRISKPEVYDPFVVSLGPFHYKMNPKLSTVDEHKLRAVDITLARLNMNVVELIHDIGEFEYQIRECYEEPIDWDAETLSWAFAMDACFILEFLKGSTRTENQSNMNLFSLVFQNLPQKNVMYHGIINDIMKMENQIPLFIINYLLRKEFGSNDRAEEELCFILFASKLFEGFPFCSPFASRRTVEERLKELTNQIHKNPVHLLDLYRMVIEDLLKPPSTESVSQAESDNTLLTRSPYDRRNPASIVEFSDTSEARNRNMNIPLTPSLCSSDDSRCTLSAELLQTAGIKFEPGQISFRKGTFGKSTLSLPQIIVDDSTVTLLRNVIAYEESQRCSWDPKDTVISHFLVLLNYLVDSAKDVSILRKAGVILSLACSDKDTACRFNNITGGITVGTYEGFEKIMEETRKHYNSRMNMWISQFQEHCSKPWYVVSIAAGILLLVMPVLQTVYTVWI